MLGQNTITLAVAKDSEGNVSYKPIVDHEHDDIKSANTLIHYANFLIKIKLSASKMFIDSSTEIKTNPETRKLESKLIKAKLPQDL